MTKNITLAVDDEVLKKVRMLATAQDTTVNALVRKHLEALAEKDNNCEKRRLAALQKLKQLSSKSESGLGSEYKFDREALYEERLIR